MIGSAQRRWAWLAPRVATILVTGITAVVLGMIMAISYHQETRLAARNGEVGWPAVVIPFAVDGIVVVASIAIYWAGQHGIRRPLPPFVTAAVGKIGRAHV